MCGITGLLERTARPPQGELEARARRMADTLTHRGPDDAGVWADGEAGVALGFRRLAIVDLTSAGAQPMTSHCGRYVVAYNGEIYNAEALRAELGPAVPNWRGHSDTEVMLECFARWGLEATLGRLVGMFALALWDRRERRLVLARDPLGKKPLYWCQAGDRLTFGSELRALRAGPGFRGEIDRDAVALYLRHACFPAPHTVYRGVRQLQPGHLLDLTPGREPRLAAYWRLSDVVEAGRHQPFAGDEEAAADALEEVLGKAVRERLVSDVPLGAFLSGGYDSTLVAALMQRAGSRPVRTFSIGFAVKGYDEAPQAAAVARHLGTDHTELYVQPEDARAVIPHLPDIYDEPFADSSQIPTYLVSRLARGHVTVALSGDGGDEVFAGYNRYAQARTFGRLSATMPRPLRAMAAGSLRLVSPAAWDRLAGALPRRLRPAQAGDKLHKLADVLAERGDGFYRRLTSHWHEPERLVPGAREPATIITDPTLRRLLPGTVERMQYLDTLTYLPDDIMTKVDRASMAVSLEARAPFLDVRVVRFAWSLPLDFKLRGGERKRILKRLAHRLVPASLLDRPKMGFGVPIDAWLRGPLRSWAEDLLDESALAAGGLLDPAPVRRRWQEHLSGRRNWQHSLWAVLMLEAWRRRWT